MLFETKNIGKTTIWGKRLLLLSVVSLISTLCTKAIEAQPAPELDRLEYFEGIWKCQQPAASTSPTGVFTWTVERDLNQFWYLGNALQVESAKDASPINSREFMGYDAAAKQLTRSVVVGNGNSYTLTASDWQDDKLIWSGTIVRMEQATPLREEIVKDSPEKFTATYFIPDENGEWTPVVDETCDRS